MTLIRNNKTARVGLPMEGGKTLYFEPGTHEYSQEDLESLQDQRAAVRAYLVPQGNTPAVLEMVDEDVRTDPVPDPDPPTAPDPPPLDKKSAAEMKDLIAKADDPEWLREVLANDPRSTVMSAADHRLAQLQADASDPPDDPPVDPPADPE